MFEKVRFQSSVRLSEVRLGKRVPGGKFKICGIPGIGKAGSRREETLLTRDGMNGPEIFGLGWARALHFRARVGPVRGVKARAGSVFGFSSSGLIMKLQLLILTG